MIGKYVIVRAEAAGVHAGVLKSQSGRDVVLHDARRLWRWDVAPYGISLSDVAIHGPVGSRSRITAAVPEILLPTAIEVIPCSADAERVIRAATVARPQ
ncbi:MAG TPA: hypothetical protein PKA07_11315 [Micropruina sp.]|nr:hypothetical protein [Micropruina sp.]